MVQCRVTWHFHLVDLLEARRSRGVAHCPMCPEGPTPETRRGADLGSTGIRRWVGVEAVDLG